MKVRELMRILLDENPDGEVYFSAIDLTYPIDYIERHPRELVIFLRYDKDKIAL